MIEWPGRCSSCKQEIEDWSEAGYYHGRWIHKRCWTSDYAAEADRGSSHPPLRSPADRSSQLELPMLLFLLLFHFGLGLAVIGWIMLDQGGHDQAGAILLATGIIAPIIGVAGVAINVRSRHRIELVRQSLETKGGWKPGL